MLLNGNDRFKRILSCVMKREQCCYEFEQLTERFKNTLKIHANITIRVDQV